MPAADRSRFRHGRRSRPPKNFGSMKKLIVLGLVALTAFSCVSTKKFNSMKAEALRLEGELTASKSRLEDMGALNDKLTAEKMQLIADTTRLSNDLKECKKRYKQLLADGSAESARMLRELEDKEMALNDRVRRVAELEGMLKSREEAIDAIRRKVTDALTGFEGKGLSISIRNGNVYVSMDDKLLFRSQNADINVMVEGHTDDVPYRPNGQLKDNLDLSAKRATTVVRLLLENKGIDPNRIIAAGRGESLPVDPAKTSEARAKNRRTEIILTPKLDELMQLMEKQ